MGWDEDELAAQKKGNQLSKIVHIGLFCMPNRTSRCLYDGFQALRRDSHTLINQSDGKVRKHLVQRDKAFIPCAEGG